MTTTVIKVRLCDMDKLAEIICEIDYELLDHNATKPVKILIEQAHEAISSMLKKHASEIYLKDEKE